LFPSATAPWEVGWRVNQQWLKNNRDPDYTIFGIGIRDSNRPQFASGDLLLGLALAHGALFDIKNKEDLASFDLSYGENPLCWKEDYKKKPIFRNVTATGAQDSPLTSNVFTSYLHHIFNAAGYREHPTIHCLRRNLAREVEKHYQAHCSSIDTVSAILDEKPQSKYIAFLQVYGQFCEPGMLVELPAHIEERILNLPEISRIKERIEYFQHCGDDENLSVAKLQYRESLVRQRRAALKSYQDSWVQAKRDQNILNRVKQSYHVTKRHLYACSIPDYARTCANSNGYVLFHGNDFWRQARLC
ncbi:hypothetical protein N7507_009491, partial [Penicillium longicatenatum]